jgi:hypothetical protein
MTVSVQRPEDAVNAALAAIGYTLRVNSLVDGTRAANLALQIYGQTRDELMRQSDWGFAERTSRRRCSSRRPTAVISRASRPGIRRPIRRSMRASSTPTPTIA